MENVDIQEIFPAEKSVDVYPAKLLVLIIKKFLMKDRKYENRKI
jgi:hypothetical protein